ncbi:hypothetical protein HYX08_06720 [Candidatus Woesearchaeota archaeon]|nr:hypothetical protein [Candidatus Woesearchaeota archaeon]
MNKSGEKFGIGLFIVLAAMSVSLISFMTEESKITGFVSYEANNLDLLEFDDMKSLGYMASGNYYIDGEGIVYWTDDEDKPAVAMVKSVSESEKSRHIYIDDEGRIGYVLDVNEK